MATKYTKRQVANCVWLYEHHGEDEFISSTFMDRYEHDWLERARREYEAKGYTFHPHVGSNRRHGFRRASGTVCVNMQEAGLLQREWTRDRYGMYYSLTDEGVRVAKAGT